jgi:hypothetical protein
MARDRWHVCMAVWREGGGWSFYSYSDAREHPLILLAMERESNPNVVLVSWTKLKAEDRAAFKKAFPAGE